MNTNYTDSLSEQYPAEWEQFLEDAEELGYEPTEEGFAEMLADEEDDRRADMWEDMRHGF